MSDSRHRFVSVALLAAFTLPAMPAWAQTTTPSADLGLPPIPAVPPVPQVGEGKPLTLAAAVDSALRQNYLIQLQAVQVSLARAALARAEAGIQPTVGFSGSYAQTWSSTTTPPITGTVGGVPFSIPAPTPTNPVYNFGLTLTYPLYSGNALQDSITIARAGVRAAEASLTATVAQVILQVRQAYYGVQLAQGQISAAQRALDAARENVRVTDARVRVGTSPRFDLLQAQVQLAQSEQSLTQGKANAVLTQQTLDTVINVPLTSTIAPATPLGLPEPPQNLERLVQTALRTRAELAAARANVEAARVNIDLAEAGLRPRITISGGPSAQTGDPTQRAPVNYSGTVTLTLAILDGGLTQANVESARQQLSQAQVQEAQLRQSVEQQVRTSYLNLQNAAETLRSAEAQLTAAREALRIANVRFQAGVGTQLEVVTAVQSQATADQAVVQAQFNYNLALAQIDQAVGAQVKF